MTCPNASLIIAEQRYETQCSTAPQAQRLLVAVIHHCLSFPKFLVAVRYKSQLMGLTYNIHKNFGWYIAL